MSSTPRSPDSFRHENRDGGIRGREAAVVICKYAADLLDTVAITRGALASCNFKRRVVSPRYIKPVVRQVDKTGG